MAEIAGDAWNAEIAAAWAGALELVATAMLEGADEAQSRERVPLSVPTAAVAQA
jgi:hypothetical protein